MSINLSSVIPGDHGQTNQSLPEEKKCVDERDFYPTIEGFQTRSDHISECLRTCGNEGNTVQEREEKIINGQVPNMNLWPFLVKLYIYSGEVSEMCGGTILNNRKRSQV